VKVSRRASERGISTDDGVEFLLLLCNGFKHDFVRLLFLYDCSWLVKYSTTISRLLWARMMYPRHDAGILRESLTQS
jgi:hypothetical protein